MKATALGVGLILIVAGGIATVGGSFGVGFLAALVGFTLALAVLTPHAGTRYGGALLASCLLSVLLMPLHRGSRERTPDPRPSPPAMTARPAPPELDPPASADERSALAVEARKAVFAEVRRAEARAKREAVRAHPDGDANTARLNPEKEIRRAQKRLKVSSALEAEYRKQIAGRYGLTDAQLDAIVQEGAAARWPEPPPGSPAPAPSPAPAR